MHTIHVQPLYHVHSSATTTTAQVAMHAFSICATALGNKTQPPPSHSASYKIRPITTITTTTTAQAAMRPFSICATALGKRPPPPPP